MDNNKNSFVNCKSRKTSLSGGTKCPPTMVRFNNTTLGGTVWACRICLKAIFAESAVAPHIAACMKENKFHLNATPPAKRDQERNYTCKVCNRTFSRQATLKSHKKQHSKSTSDTESDDESPKKRSKKFHYKNKSRG